MSARKGVFGSRPFLAPRYRQNGSIFRLSCRPNGPSEQVSKLAAFVVYLIRHSKATAANGLRGNTAEHSSILSAGGQPNRLASQGVRSVKLGFRVTCTVLTVFGNLGLRSRSQISLNEPFCFIGSLVNRHTIDLFPRTVYRSQIEAGPSHARC